MIFQNLCTGDTPKQSSISVNRRSCPGIYDLGLRPHRRETNNYSDVERTVRRESADDVTCLYETCARINLRFTVTNFRIAIFKEDEDDDDDDERFL